jgi:hypothetical protein
MLLGTQAQNITLFSLKKTPKPAIMLQRNLYVDIGWTNKISRITLIDLVCCYRGFSLGLELTALTGSDAIGSNPEAI